MRRETTIEKLTLGRPFVERVVHLDEHLLERLIERRDQNLGDGVLKGVLHR